MSQSHLLQYPKALFSLHDIAEYSETINEGWYVHKPNPLLVWVNLFLFNECKRVYTLISFTTLGEKWLA